MQNNLKTCISDIDIVIEAIKNKDSEDAIQMLLDIKEDLKVLELIS